MPLTVRSCNRPALVVQVGDSQSSGYKYLLTKFVDGVEVVPHTLVNRELMFSKQSEHCIKGQGFVSRVDVKCVLLRSQKVILVTDLQSWLVVISMTSVLTLSMYTHAVSYTHLTLPTICSV